jgi:hypothetical protein
MYFDVNSKFFLECTVEETDCIVLQCMDMI